MTDFYLAGFTNVFVTELRETIRLKPKNDIEDAMLTWSERCTAKHSVQTQAMRISSLREERVETLSEKCLKFLVEYK